MFGPAAQVDTQTAGSSQWTKEALERESGNFFDYLSNTISEKLNDELLDENNGEEGESCVTFEELFDPITNSQIVAAQAFYHVLSLATKGRVWVQQDVGDNDTPNPFGAIRIGVIV